MPDASVNAPQGIASWSVLAHMLRDAHVVVASSLSESRWTVRAMLSEVGFQRFEFCDTVDDLVDHLKLHEIDLLVSDSELRGEDVLDLIRGIRHGEHETDPFLATIILTWNGDQDHVRRAIDSGADDLLVMPVSTARMSEAVDTLVHRRKPWVVTSDYVGPDRRKAPRQDGMPVPLLEVPNTLRIKATHEPEEVDREDILNAINGQKVERHAFQVVFLAKVIADHYTDGPRAGKIGEQLDRLKDVARDLAARVERTKYFHQAEFCLSLVTVAEQIAKAPGSPRPSDLELLRQVAVAIKKGFDFIDDKSVAAALDIARSIRGLPGWQQKP